MYCKPDDLLRVWYRNFKKKVKLNTVKEHKAVWEKYN